MAELRYQIIIDGTQVASDYTDPDPTTDTGQIVVANLTSVAKVQFNAVNAVGKTLATDTDRGGVESYSFVAFTAPGTFFVGKATAAGAETWQVAANRWFVINCEPTTDDIIITNSSGADMVVTGYFGGTVI